MRKFFFPALAIVLALSCCTSLSARTRYPNRAAKIAATINDPKTRKVVVVCHRGDWRNYPENSIPAIKSIIRMGADMMELDLKLSKDSVLVLSHDRTLDRCTNGHGLVSDYTLAELKQLKLRRANGITTDSVRIPTLREALLACKDKIVVNVDQGYEYYDMVLKITEELGVTDQVLIKGRKPVKEVKEKLSSHRHNMMYMPVIDIQTEQGKALFNEYMSTGTVPIAYEVCWQEMTPEVKEAMDKILDSGSKIWVNTMWGSLDGHLDDDAALECGNPAEIYGQVIGLGATIIQTDRPEMLLKYLRKKHLHD